jgi:very-short-patch-repair endonuclease
VQLINDALRKRVDPEEWERRAIRVGTPPDFQGDERDIVLLSLVTAPDHTRRQPQTRLDAQRSYNVAASRARDQLWLFHSVMVDRLRPDDLRAQLLTYMTSAPVAAAAAMPEDVREDERHPDFDSLFEQRVFRRIQQRGYHVTPQVEVNSRRIDLVVTGAQGKLAVECDGDAWHSSPEQMASDFARELELRRCGWEFWRIRESRYYLDPEAALADLWLALDRRGIGPTQIDAEGAALTAWTPRPLASEEGVELDPENEAAPATEVVKQVVPIRTAPARPSAETPPPAPRATATPPAHRSPPPTARRAPAYEPPQRYESARRTNRPDDEARALVLDLAANGAVTSEIVRRYLEITVEEARNLLTQMTVAGQLERREVTKGTHYVLPSSPPQSRTAPPIDRPAPRRPDTVTSRTSGEQLTLPAAPGTGTGEKELATLTRDFGRRILRDLQLVREAGYRPGYLRRMVTQYGGLTTAKQILATEKVHEGLSALWEMGLLQHSVEAAVLDPAFKELFSDDERERARRRLADLGHEIGA